jgi:hypothetical protein
MTKKIETADGVKKLFPSLSHSKLVDDTFKPKEKSFIEEVIDKDKIELGQQETQDQQLLFTREIIEKLTDVKDIDMKTELNDKEILLFARIEVLSGFYDIQELKDFAISIFRKKLSRKRGWRKEVLQAISQIQPSEETNNNIFPDLLLGKNK